MQIALLIDEHRIPGTIDLPLQLAGSPKLNLESLTVLEAAAQAAKNGKLVSAHVFMQCSPRRRRRPSTCSTTSRKPSRLPPKQCKSTHS